MNYFDSLTTVFEELENKKDFSNVQLVHDLILPLSINTKFDQQLANAYLKVNETLNVYDILNEKGLINGVIYYIMHVPKFSDEERHLLSTAVLGICLVYDRDAEDKLQEYFNRIEEEKRKFLEEFIKAFSDAVEESIFSPYKDFKSEVQFITLILECYHVEVLPTYDHEFSLYVNGKKIEDTTHLITPDKKCLVHIAKEFTDDVKLFIPVSEYTSLSVVNTKGDIIADKLDELYFKVSSFVCDSGNIKVHTNGEVVSINTDSGNIYCAGTYRERKLSTISGQITQDNDD